MCKAGLGHAGLLVVLLKYSNVVDQVEMKLNLGLRRCGAGSMPF